MRAIHFFRVSGSVSGCFTLCFAKRLCQQGCRNLPSAFLMPCGAPEASTANVACASASSSSSFSASSTSSQGAVEHSLQLDDTHEWITSFLQRSVDSGRQSQEAADYFRSIMKDESEFRKCLLEARRLMGDQDPEKLTRYQQAQFADRLNNYMSGIASDKLRRAHAEEQSTKRYTQDGTPTGENYWFEAGNMLSSPAVPEYIKDEILHDMQHERLSRSPAFDLPAEEERLAAEDNDYAAHLRRQRRRLLSDVDIKPERLHVMMSAARSIVNYFADRHTVAVVIAFFLYVCIIMWCSSTGTREMKQRTSAVARRHSILGASSFVGWSNVSDVAVLTQSISVAFVRLTEADAELLNGGPLDRLFSPVERRRQLLPSLTSRWQYHFPVGDFTLISAPLRLANSGIQREWIAQLTAAYPTCVFAPVVGNSTTEARDSDTQLLLLPSRRQTHQRSLMREEHQQSLRVLLLDTLPSLEGLQEAGAAAEGAVSTYSTNDPLFVFVTEDATHEWSTAADMAEMQRSPTERWRSEHSKINAWEEMLHTASMPQVPTDAAGPAVMVLSAMAVHPSPYFTHDLRQRRRKKKTMSLSTITNVSRYIPRLAMHLAYTYKAPYVIVASWCSAVGAYGWNDTKWFGDDSEGRAVTFVLCLHGSEVMEVVPSRQKIIRTVQK